MRRADLDRPDSGGIARILTVLFCALASCGTGVGSETSTSPAPAAATELPLAAEAFEPVRTAALIEELARAAGRSVRIEPETLQWLGDHELVFSRDLAISTQDASELLEPLLDAFGLVVLPESDGSSRLVGPATDALGDAARVEAALEEGLGSWHDRPATYRAMLVKPSEPNLVAGTMGQGVLGANRPGLSGRLRKGGVVVWGSGRTVATFAALLGAASADGSAAAPPIASVSLEPSSDLGLPAGEGVTLRDVVAAYGELLDATLVFDAGVLEKLERAPVPPHEGASVPRAEVSRFVESALCEEGLSLLVDRASAPALLSLHDAEVGLVALPGVSRFQPIFSVVDEAGLEGLGGHPAFRVGLTLALEHRTSRELGLELRGVPADPTLVGAWPNGPRGFLVFGRAREVAAMVREIRALDVP